MKSFFDVDNRLSRLAEMGDTLVKLNEVVNWEIFRASLEEIFYSEDHRAGGRHHYDRVLLFKILILQSLYNIADDNTEYQINDRLSFQRFLGLDIGDKVPDAKTIWSFRERLCKSGRERELFDLYNMQLEQAGVITKRGSIVDATFIERPRQRKSKGEPNIEPEEISGNDSTGNTHRIRQIDQDAKFAMKNGKSHYGFKDHIKVDTDSKLITAFSVTGADRHDGKEAPAILDNKDKVVYVDACYRGKEIEAAMQNAAPNAQIYVVRKHDGYHTPTQEQLDGNVSIQHIRSRVEHVFGYMTKSMGGKQIRCCGLARARLAITLKNLAYNMRRACLIMG